MGRVVDQRERFRKPPVSDELARQNPRRPVAAPDRSKLIVVDGEFHDSINWDRTGVLWKEATGWFEQY
ncbi:MAG TPA: hypothetical protein VNI78_13190, partial [Vicinamibacterales bacterium]|nr:hypothetical protein [Vicinamibacterales bacterium]